MLLNSTVCGIHSLQTVLLSQHKEKRLKIEFELSEKQSQALTDVIQALGHKLTPEEFTKRVVIERLIQNRQQMIANELKGE